MIKTKLLTAIILVACYLTTTAQTTNTSPLPAGETITGNHLHAGHGNEVWTDATSLYFNYRGAAAATYFWNLGGDSGKPIMTLLNNGNVGIGTTNPLGKLHIQGNGTYDALLRLSNNGSNGGDWSLISSNDSWTAGPGNLLFASGDPSSANTKFMITKLGNVGIGTTNPQAKLDVQGKLHVGGEIYGYNILTFQDDSRFSVTSATIPSLTYSPFSMPQYGIAAPNTGGSADLWIAGSNAIRMFTAGNPTPGVSILSSGNVGIGTQNPAYKLDVLGTIRAKEVLVNLGGGADFVFEKGYKLLPIEHVANYVQENKHLPDIPSANEMVKNGVSMGDMQVKLLQKVEELTLYAIEQDKSKKELENKYNVLLEKVEMLTKQIEKK